MGLLIRIIQIFFPKEFFFLWLFSQSLKIVWPELFSFQYVFLKTSVNPFLCSGTILPSHINLSPFTNSVKHIWLRRSYMVDFFSHSWRTSEIFFVTLLTTSNSTVLSDSKRNVWRICCTIYWRNKGRFPHKPNITMHLSESFRKIRAIWYKINLQWTYWKKKLCKANSPW